MSDPMSDERLFTHLLGILSVSAGMVGVCLTAIGLIGVIKSASSIETFCDELLAFNAFLYLGAAVLCFTALRTPLRKRADAVALVVDGLFCLGLAVTTVSCGLLVWIVV